MTVERLKEIENLLSKECDNYSDNCNKCPYQTECEQYQYYASEYGEYLK